MKAETHREAEEKAQRIAEEQAAKEERRQKIPHQPMEEGEPKNFLRLSAALSIFLATEIPEDLIKTAEDHLEKYLDSYFKVRVSQSAPFQIAHRTSISVLRF